MTQTKRSILIVGGGTSGWITAGLLRRKLGENWEISLIEAEDIPTIGVGEATVPNLRGVLKDLGIPENDYLNACNGSFKMAIKFVNWRQPVRSAPHYYYHPFGQMPQADGFDFFHLWLRAYRSGYPEGFDYACSMIPRLCDEDKNPKFLDSPAYGGPVEYAYHMDAGLFAVMLRGLCKQRGVMHHVGKVLNVELNENGEIDHLLTEPQGKLKSDLYVDCSGFRGLLINQALGEPFLSYSKYLLCDRALAISVPRRGTSISPYTTATALNAGWVWDIPLQTRIGTGYVYSSTFLSPEEAEREFRAHLGNPSDASAINPIKIRVGRNRDAWVKNCVSIGLAGGFIEPLESSGIAFIYATVYQLLKVLEPFDTVRDRVKGFNEVVGSLYDLIRDFIVLHYCLTNREDTEFWRAVRHESAIPDSLQAVLEGLRERFPNGNSDTGLYSFNAFDLISILAGMDFLPRDCNSLVERRPVEWSVGHLEKFKAKWLHFIEELPDHAEYLEQIRSDVPRPK